MICMYFYSFFRQMSFFFFSPTRFIPFQRAVLVAYKRNVTRKFETKTHLWQIFIQARMWPIQEKENRQLLKLWPNFILFSKLYKCVVTVLLLTSTSLFHFHPVFLICISKRQPFQKNSTRQEKLNKKEHIFTLQQNGNWEQKF